MQGESGKVLCGTRECFADYEGPQPTAARMKPERTMNSTLPPTRPASVPPQLHDLETASKRLACCTRTLMRQIHRGRIRAVKLGRDWRISEKEIRRICEGEN